jgi:hypothetical protein
MQSKKIWSSCLTTLLLLGSTATAQAEIGFRQVSASESQGSGGKDVPTLDISPLWGLTLSFIKTNEVVQQVRIGDPSRIVVDFDTPLGGVSNTETRQSAVNNTSPATRSGASVIYLRQIGDPLKLPTRLTASAKKSSKIPLTVITIDRSNQRKLYQFLLVIGKNTKYSTVEVVPDSLIPRLGKPVAPIATVTVNVPEQFAKGLTLAQKKNIVVAGSPLDRRLQVLLGLLQKGEALETAAQQADVPLAVANQIMQLKS